MAVSNYVLYSGRSNSGIQSNKNEDYIVFREYDDILFLRLQMEAARKIQMLTPLR